MVRGEPATVLSEMGGPDFLTENDVVQAIAAHLQSQGDKLVQQRTTDQRGIDVIAESPETTWYIEAKGATSSKKGTSRYGKSFDTGQINSHVSRAIYTAMKIAGIRPAGDRTRVALGLPENLGHRKMVAPVRESLGQLGIAVFWVDADLRVACEDSVASQTSTGAVPSESVLLDAKLSARM